MIKTSLIAAIVAILVTFTVMNFVRPQQSVQPTAQTAFERVVQTNTLRCGYVVWPPEFNKDAATGRFSGLAYDLIEEAAKRLKLKVEWTEEVNFTGAVPGLEQGRYDMLCFTFYRRSLEATKITHSKPLFYSGVGVFVRPDDHRFDTNLSLINKPEVTIATLDGDQAMIIADEEFSHAKRLALPAPNDFSSLLLSVAQNKADVSFANIGNAHEFMAKNPGLVRQIQVERPIRVFSHGFATAWQDGGLMKAFDIVFDEMQHHGFTEKALRKYEPSPGVWFSNTNAFEKLN